MKSLREITNSFLELANRDDLTEEEATQFGTELALELKEKTGGIISWVEEENALIDKIKAEEARLKEFRISEERKLERFKEYTVQCMEQLGLKEIKNELGILSIAKCPASVEILSEEDVEDTFKEVKISETISKTKIKDYYKATGKIPAGVTIIDNKKTIKIK